MNLIRPEVRAGLLRWREALLGAGLLVLGLRLILISYGALFLIGCGLFLAGGGFLVSGVHRARFRTEGSGAGVVDIDERQITYFGPFGGGSLSIEDLVEIGVDPSRSWLLRDMSGTHLMIPMNAEGSDALFDAFAAVRGLTASRVAEAARSRPETYTVIWARPAARLH